jgi:hypothetical protein
MNIEDRIAEEMLHLTARGDTPKNIYLGELELQELRCWVNELYGFNFSNIDGSNEGLEVMGLNLFEVKTKSHFNITR